MIIDSFLNSLPNMILISFVVCALMVGFYLLGVFFIKLLRLPAFLGSSVMIVVGLTLAMFVAWYAYRLELSLNILILCFLVVMLGLFVFELVKSIKTNELSFHSSIYMVMPFAFAFSVQALIAFNVTNHPIGSLGNNDIYDWSILANYLLGLPGYDNVFTITGGSAQQYRIDSFGTFFIIALFAEYLSMLPLEVSTIFTVFCMSLVGLSIFDIIKRGFLFKDGMSFGIALLVGAGSFFFYLAYHNFYGQLLATIFYLGMLLLLLEFYGFQIKSDEISFIKRMVYFLFPLLGILISYQSGFFVFVFFAVMLAVVMVFVERVSFKAPIAQNMRKVLFPLLCGLALALMLVPELTVHAVNRTIEVKDALNGWPLPLLSPVYLFSIPYLKLFPALLAGKWQYLVMISFSIFAFIYYWRRRRESLVSKNALVLLTLFLLALVAYILAYYMKGGIYQVWKFAAFVVLPMSFMFYVICTLFVYKSKFFSRLLTNIWGVTIVSGCLLVLLITPYKYGVTSVTDKINEFKGIDALLSDSGVKNIVLKAVPYSDVMIAFNVLSNNFKLFPMVDTYVRSVDSDVIRRLDGNDTRVLVHSDCFDVGSSSKQYEIIMLDEMLSDSFKHSFGTDVYCPESFVSLVDGFSVNEGWGVWSDGNKASMKVRIPELLSGRDLDLQLLVRNFGGSQSVRVEISGASKVFDVAKKRTLDFNIAAINTHKKYLVVDFYFTRPVRPADIIDGSTDNRFLAIGFISATMGLSKK